MKSSQLLKEFWKFARPYRKTYYSAFVFMFFALGTELIKPFLLKTSLEHITKFNLEGLKFIALVFLGILFLEYFFNAFFSFFMNTAFLKTITTIRESLFKHVLHLKMGYFDTKPVGALLTRTVNDTESLGETLRSGIATVFIDILTIIGLLFVMTQINLELTPVLMIAAPLVFLVVRWFGYKLRESFLKVRKMLAKSNAYMSEGISGIEIIQLFNHQKPSNKAYADINVKYRGATIWSNVYDAGLYASIDGMAAIVTAGILYWGFGLYFGVVAVSSIIVYVDLVERIFIPTRNLSAKFASLQQALAALERIFSLFHTKENIPLGELELSQESLKIEFRKVNFRYRSEDPLVLKEIGFQVSPGEVVALVGATGSGKSTIGKLLTRSYDGYEGEIKINDMELAQINLHQLRSKIAVVHQDISLFSGTIRDNITLNNPKITEENITEAIKVVKLERLINKVPGGLDFAIKEEGGNLSVGEAQLVIFARAIAHNTPIIVMDEATSNIDSLTEGWIQEALEEIFKIKTVIVVAHRLSTIAKADNILVMQKGQIIEQGKHQELIEKGGYYSELIQSAQFPKENEQI